MNPDPNDNNQTSVDPAPQITSPAPKPQNNRKLIIGIAIGLGILLLILIGLVGVLLAQKQAGDTAPQDDSKQSTSDEDTKDSSKVVKTVAYKENRAFEIYIFEPKQSATNTTINYEIKNVCKSSCKSQEYAGSYNLGASNDGSAYLLDSESGTKFNPIIDEKNKPLATEACAAFLEPGESLDCFASFTKVADGTEFSFVLRGLKVDGLKVE